MANTITSQTIIDGPKTAIIKIYLLSDGVAGEVVDQIVVDVSALTPAASKCSLEKVWWSFTGFDATLEWEATADVVIMPLASATGTSELDFTSFGGIPNNAGAGVTGDISLSTTGFTAATDTGVLILQVRKNV